MQLEAGGSYQLQKNVVTLTLNEELNFGIPEVKDLAIPLSLLFREAVSAIEQ
ncbi:MAG: hypothetical protein ACFFC6_08625 [Promethearchaeota archaeon]